MRRIIVAAVTAGLVIAAWAPASLATTTKHHYPDGMSVIDSVLVDGEYSMNGTVLSARGAVYLYVDSGSPYVTGTDTVVINYDLDLATGSGELWGTDRIEQVAFPGGAFDCVWHGTFKDFRWDGKVVCHGDGSLDGWQLRGLLLAEPGGNVAAFPHYVFLPSD